MDLQLYRIDDQNYLVDFRNLGYRAIKKDSTSPTTSQTDHLNNNNNNMPNTADEVRSRKPEVITSRKNSSRNGSEVSSPYLFLEAATRLIVELASPQA